MLLCLIKTQGSVSCGQESWPSCIKRVRPSKSCMGEKSCEIKCGGHEIAAMVFMIIILIMHKAIVNNFVIIGIITFNFTTFFSPRLFEGHTLFYTAWLFLHGSYIRVVLYIVEIMKVCIFKILNKTSLTVPSWFLGSIGYKPKIALRMTHFFYSVVVSTD